MRTEPEPGLQLVLAGGGHTHVLMLRVWAMRGPPPGARILLVNRCSTALYSGMVPGLVAGLYGEEECAIDLRRLCELSGVGFIRAEITGLDPALRELRLAGRPPLRWDRISLDVGAVTPEADDPSDGGMAVKPLEPFLVWCRTGRKRVSVVGSGAAGVEVALALRARHGAAVELRVRHEGLRLGSAAADRAGARLLAAAGIPVRRAGPAAGALVRCTGSRAPAWLAASGLPCDPRSGRVFTAASLEVEGHTGLFASGDCGVLRSQRRPPSGVWAVRAAPTLESNLRRSLAASTGRTARPLRRWRPQARALQLLGDGGAVDGVPRALALWGPLALGPSRWIWRWKERIDRRFLARFTALEPMGAGGAAMPCRGCAAKLGADALTAALERLEPGADEDAADGHGGPPRRDDAAVVAETAAGELLLQSIDGFPALVSDDWLNGRLTALHACSDLWASGARVVSAQALVTLPRAAPTLQQDGLLQTLAGVRSVLDPLGAPLVGGHTLQQRSAGEGLILALTVNGCCPPERFWPKGGLRPGQALLLSRPLGSGVLFAAAMAGAARPEWIDGALAVLQQSQAPLVEVLAAQGCRACTDVTGFGLLGHLGEMLRAAPLPLRLELDLGAIPTLPGSWSLLERGFASSLAPANRGAWRELDSGRMTLAVDPGAAGLGVWRELLVDPQTCGPLLAAVPPAQAAASLEAVRRAGFPEAALIGRVLPADAVLSAPGG